MRFITVQGQTAERKVRAKVGDNVVILKKITVKRGSKDVAKFPAPVIVEIEKDDDRRRLVARVQFHTQDKRVHVQPFYGTELQLMAPMFKIGDHVEVVEKQRGIMVPVGSQGTVVGGDGATFYISFIVDRSDTGSEFAPPLNVSHDRIDGSALKLIKASEVRATARAHEENDDSSSSSSSSGSGSSSEDGDSNDDEDEDCSSSSTSSSLDEPVHDMVNDMVQQVEITPSAFVRRHLSTSAHRALLRHLNATTLRNFEHWFHHTRANEPHVVLVDSLPELQKLLNAFTRELQPAFHLTPAHKIALRHLGASSSDLLEIEQQAQLRGGSVEDIMQFYSNMKHSKR